MAYENTSVAVGRSQEAIRKLLLENNANGIAFISQREPLSEGFEAQIEIDSKVYRIRIVASVRKIENTSRGRWYRGSYRTAKSDAAVQEEELRRVWRVLFYHLKSTRRPIVA